MNKVKHDYKCEGCGKIATINLQTMYHRWDITKEGEFENEDTWEGEVQEMLCIDCYDNRM